MKKIFLLLLLSAVLSGCSPVGFNVKIENRTFFDASFKGVKEIRVTQTALPVRLVPSDSDKTEAKCYVKYMTVNRAKFEIVARKEGSTLKIYQMPRQGMSFRGDVSGYIALSVPAGVKVSISTVSGAIRASGLSLAELEARTVSGNISIKGGEISDMETRTVSGNIGIRGVSCQKGKAITVSGDVLLAGCRGQEVAMAAVSGDIRAKGLEYGRVKGNTVSGDISLSSGRTPEKIDIHTVSGNVDISLPGDLKGNRYRVSTTSGGINLVGVAKTRKKLMINPGEYISDVRIVTVSGSVKVAGGLHKSSTGRKTEEAPAKEKEQLNNK